MEEKNNDKPQGPDEAQSAGISGRGKTAREMRLRAAVLASLIFFVVAGAVLYANRKPLVSFIKKIFPGAPFLKSSPAADQSAVSFPDPNEGPVPDSISTSDAAENQEVKPDERQADNPDLEDLAGGSVIEEASSMGKSKSDIWWLNSGGIMLVGKKQFGTNAGALPEKSRWQKLYAKTNPTDTDGGYYPQNIFRLVTRSKWKNLSQSVYFYIKAFNFSKSKNRNESNGVLFFNRYQDGDDLYYAGLRVDGDAVIKKKMNGKYYTMAEKKFFPSDDDYDRDKNSNLMPTHTWLGMKTEVSTDSDGKVHISLYVDMNKTGNWKLVLETSDKGGKYGKTPIADKGYAGIRTDFMDVQFENYHIEKLQ